MEVNETALKELLQNSKKQVEILERILNGSTVYQNNVAVPKNLVENSDIRFPKDTAFIKTLYGSKGLNDWQNGFLQNLIDNEYTSITVKQKEVLDQIAKQVKNG